MKIVIISDTHGNNEEVLTSILKDEKPDLLIHLGDYVEDGEKISKILDIPGVIVKGNGDFRSNYPEDRVIEVENKKIFLTHGHKYDVRYNLDKIYYKALESGADIALFGHSHIALNTMENGILIMNPGSPSLPRGINRVKSYGIIKIEKEIEAKILELK